MKLLLARLFLFYTSQSFAENSKCISKAQAQQVANQMEILVDTFNRVELVKNLKFDGKFYFSQISGEHPPECEFDGQCESEFHQVLNSGVLTVHIDCSGNSFYNFENDIEHD